MERSGFLFLSGTHLVAPVYLCRFLYQMVVNVCWHWCTGKFYHISWKWNHMCALFKYHSRCTEDSSVHCSGITWALSWHFKSPTTVYLGWRGKKLQKHIETLAIFEENGVVSGGIPPPHTHPSTHTPPMASKFENVYVIMSPSIDVAKPVMHIFKFILNLAVFELKQTVFWTIDCLVK